MIIDKNKSIQIAEILLKIHAIKLQPSNFFTWSSGKKSPIYCDNRLLLSYVKERNIVVNQFTKLIKKNYNSIDYIAGVATGAIALGIMVAEQLKLPFIYVRSEAKGHGRKNQIEGQLRKNSNVIVIEDLISTGKSSLKALQAIEKNNAKVIGLISIFTYGFFNPNTISCPYFSLCNYTTLIDYAIQKKLINKTEKELLFKWQKENTN